MSSGKSLLLLCILPFGMLCLSAISMMFVMSVGSVYVGGHGGLSENGLCVFCKLCPVCFIVVGKGALHDLGDSKTCLFNFTFSFNHINW